MFAQVFRFDASRLHSAFAPRKPRHPLARIAVGLLGIGVLALLVFFSLFVGIAMLGIGLGYRLLRARKPSAPRPVGRTSSANVVDGEYRIVGKTILPSA
ncbi:hypothetical protein [Cognatiluteimonas profundi]|uniref:hypothetical protein n=1 Tax=Cognatiluteimonas profundi TaxID=2594501 RepID=UPI00131D3B4E|nr:hypothetical protein [Lysobacter profundi]